MSFFANGGERLPYEQVLHRQRGRKRELLLEQERVRPLEQLTASWWWSVVPRWEVIRTKASVLNVVARGGGINSNFDSAAFFAASSIFFFSSAFFFSSDRLSLRLTSVTT
jgi:hypothetical protein